MASKGEMLERLFSHMDNLKLSDKMRELFIKNDLTIMDLTQLKKKNESDYLTWMKMHKRNNRLMSFSTFIILER
jgi:hypothetical protein